MKKLFTLTLSLLFALSAAAQATDTSVQFADKDGNIIADGSTLNLTAYESDFFGDIMVPSGLFINPNLFSSELCGSESCRLIRY